MLSDPVRFSNLKHIGKSPLHYHHAVTVGRDDKPWLRGGRGLHAVLFGTPYVVFDGASRNSKAWDMFLEVELGDKFTTHPGDAPEVILAKELPVYEAQAAAIRAELKRLDLSHLLEGDIEKRIEWEWLGRKCGGTPDVQRIDGDILTTVDVKTSCNADPRKFVWDAKKFCYAEQVTWYGHGKERLLIDSREMSAFDELHHEARIIVVEKTAPFPVVVWNVTAKRREECHKTLRLWFEQLLACEASNSWPGYVQCVQDLDVLESEGLTLQIGGEDVEVE